MVLVGNKITSLSSCLTRFVCDDHLWKKGGNIDADFDSVL